MYRQASRSKEKDVAGLWVGGNKTRHKNMLAQAIEAGLIEGPKKREVIPKQPTR